MLRSRLGKLCLNAPLLCRSWGTPQRQESHLELLTNPPSAFPPKMFSSWENVSGLLPKGYSEPPGTQLMGKNKVALRAVKILLPALFQRSLQRHRPRNEPLTVAGAERTQSEGWQRTSTEGPLCLHRDVLRKQWEKPKDKQEREQKSQRPGLER